MSAQESSRFETPRLPGFDNVTYLDPDSHGKQLNKQYSKMIKQFRRVFEACRDNQHGESYYDRQLDICLERYDDGKISRLAVLRATIPKSSQFAVSYKIARGFTAEEYSYDKERDYTKTQQEVFSLNHQGCSDEQWLYCEGYWTSERLASVSGWLGEQIPKSKMLILSYFEAANNPVLNPQLAENIQKNSEVVAKLTKSVGHAAVLPFSTQPTTL